MRTRKSVLIGMVLGSMLAGGAIMAADKPTPPKTKVIDSCKAKQPAVTFNHEKHQAIEGVTCEKCHHKADYTACSTCHAKEQGEGDKKIGTCKEMGPSKNPYHKACISCHKEKKGAAPTKCADCHKK